MLEGKGEVGNNGAAEERMIDFRKIRKFTLNVTSML